MEFDKYNLDEIKNSNDSYLKFIYENILIIENLYLEVYNYSIPRDDSILIYGENDIISRKFRRLERNDFLLFEDRLKRDIIEVLKKKEFM